MEVDMCKNNVPYINHFIANIQYKTTSVQKGQVTLGIPSPISKAYIYESHTPLFRHLNTNHIKLCSSCKYPNKPEIIRRKHTVILTGFGAYSSTCCKGQTNVPASWGWSAPILHSLVKDTTQLTCTIAYTVYPKKYAHGFCFAVLCCGYTLTDFAISIRLTSLALWQSNDCPSASKATLMNMDKYFMWIHYERLHNHNKAKHNKTVCIFLGIYCMQ